MITLQRITTGTTTETRQAVDEPMFAAMSQLDPLNWLTSQAMANDAAGPVTFGYEANGPVVNTIVAINCGGCWVARIELAAEAMAAWHPFFSELRELAVPNMFGLSPEIHKPGFCNHHHPPRGILLIQLRRHIV